LTTTGDLSACKSQTNFDTNINRQQKVDMSTIPGYDGLAHPFSMPTEALTAVGEFRKTLQPQNVKFYEIHEISFQESRTCEPPKSRTCGDLKPRTCEAQESWTCEDLES
jgi:hypothetical protein